VLLVLLLAAPSAALAQSPPYSPPGLCAQIITPEIFNELKNDPIDPLVRFEQWRKEHKSMMEASPLVICRHLAWLAAHGLTTGSNAIDEAAWEAELAGPQASTAGPNIPLANGVSDYQGEMAIAVDPNNSQHLVANANTFRQDFGGPCCSPTGGCSSTFGTQELYGSTDGGTTWIDSCAPWPSSLSGGVPGAVAWFGSDPAVAWDSNGNAYAAYMLISQDNAGNAGVAIVAAKSTDNGATWPRTATGLVVNNISSTTIFDDKDLMAVDTSSGQPHSHTNRVYVIWDENNVERVAHSDNLTTWTIVPVGTGSEIGGDVKVGSDGTVYAVWNFIPGAGGDTTKFRKSTDGGTTWSPVASIYTHTLNSFGGLNFPPAQDQRGINAFCSLGVDNTLFPGRLYIATTDTPTGNPNTSDFNIYTKFSSDGGSTWSARHQVNDDAGTATQFFPWLAVDEADGSVNVSWYDTRNFTASGNRKAQIFYARSTDGGNTFEPNLLVTDSGSNFTNHVNYCDENSMDNGNYNANQYGDYSGMAALSMIAHPLWTDSRQFYPTSGNAKIEDAATATVTNACTTPPSPVAGNNGPICAGQTLQLTASTVTGATYSWTGPNGFTSTQQNPSIPNATTAATGTYTVIASVGACASPPATTTATVNALPATPSASNNGPICAGQTLQLNASTISGATYSWSGPNGFTSTLQNPSIANAQTAATGTYSVTATVNGCTSVAGTTNATVNAIPAAPAASNNGPICVGATLQLSASTIAGATYSWTGPNGFTSNTQNPSIANAQTANSGTYSVTATVNNCTSSAGTTVATVSPVPSTPVATNNGPICAGQTLQLSASTISGAAYSWSGPNGFNSTLQNPSVPNATTAATGTYSVTATVNGCASVAGTTTATVNATPGAPNAANNGPLCVGQTLQLTASTIAGATYSWAGPNGFTSMLQNPSIASVTTAAAGTYSVTATVNSCTSVAATTTVTVNPLPTALASGGGTICTGGSVPISGSGGVSCTWSPSTGLSDPNSCNPIANPSATTIYTLTVTDANGCPSINAPTVTVTVGPGTSPTPSITVLQCLTPNTSGLTASTPDNPGDTYAWTLTGGTLDSGQGTSAISFTSGPPGTPMSVQVVETNAANCAGTATVSMETNFLDVAPSNPFYSFVCTLARNSITGGCGGGNFCPASPVLRSQMSVFLLRSEHGSSYLPPACTVASFTDVPCSNPFASWIYQLVAEGITSGCTATTFCPNNSVLRNSMAVFLLVTEHGPGYTPPACTLPGQFTDVPCPGGGFTNWIYQLVAEGITGGCTTTTYCPTQAVSRAQMSVFLVTTFALP
jgi:hypothetical protein